MTLEQIKNRQEYLNDYLTKVLQESVNTVDFIAGQEDVKEELSVAVKEPNGLLEQLSYQQDRTEKFINYLSNNQARLSSNVYKPCEAVCMTKD